MDTQGTVATVENNVPYEKLFRTALGGFKKEDVINWLERSARSQRKDSERYADHVRRLETELEELKIQRDEAVKATTLGRVALQASAEGAEGEKKVLAAENTALRSEIQILQERLKETEAENLALHDESKYLQERLEEARSAEAIPEAPPEDFSENLAALEARLTEADAEARAARDTIALLEAQAAQAAQEIRDVRAALAEAEDQTVQVAQAAAEEVRAAQLALAAAEEQAAQAKLTAQESPAPQVFPLAPEPVAPVIKAPAPQPVQEAPQTALREENEKLARRCGELEEKLRSYELEKLRMEAIEEAAHRDAARIRQEAGAQVQVLRGDVAAQVTRMRGNLEEVAAQLDRTIREIYGELSDCGTRYSALRRATDELRAKLGDFRIE